MPWWLWLICCVLCLNAGFLAVLLGLHINSIRERPYQKLQPDFRESLHIRITDEESILYNNAVAFLAEPWPNSVGIPEGFSFVTDKDLEEVIETEQHFDKVEEFRNDFD